MIDRARRGDTSALDLLLRRHHRRIHALCRRLTGNDDDANDATQEALITIVKRLDRFDGRSAFGTWAFRVATNACLDEMRRRARRPLPLELQESGRVIDPLTPDTAGPVADRLALDDALQRIPNDFRVAVVLRDVLRCDYAEIAEILDVPLGTVRSRIARGRRLLADHLRDPGNSPTQRERPMTNRPYPAPPHPESSTGSHT